jgi:hypothetical protein
LKSCYLKTFEFVDDGTAELNEMVQHMAVSHFFSFLNPESAFSSAQTSSPFSFQKWKSPGDINV